MRKLVKVVLVLVLATIVVASGCIGGGGKHTTTPSNTETQNTTKHYSFNLELPQKITTNGNVVEFTVQIRTDAVIQNLEGALKFGKMTFKLNNKNIEQIEGGYKVTFYTKIPPGTAYNGQATIKVVAYTSDGNVLSTEKNITLTISEAKHNIKIGLDTKTPSVMVSTYQRDPLTLTLHLTSDTNGKLVITRISDTLGYVTGIDGLTEFTFTKGSISYYLNVDYNISKVLNGNGGQDTITVEGYYYTFDNPQKKIPFKVSTSVLFTAKQPEFDFEVVKTFMVLNTYYVYDANKSYGLYVVKLLQPVGFANALKVSYKIDTNSVNYPIPGLDPASLVAVVGSVNYTETFKVYESHTPSEWQTVTVTPGDNVVTLLVKVDKIDIYNSDQLANLLKSLAIVTLKVLGAEVSDGVWKTPDSDVLYTEVVGVATAVDVANNGSSCESGSCEVSLSGITAGVSELYTPTLSTEKYGAKVVYEMVVFLNYPHPEDKNITVRVTFSMGKGYKVLISTVPLTRTQFESAIDSRMFADENATIYLPFGNGKTSSFLFVYALDVGQNSILNPKLVLSTQGTNGEVREITLNLPNMQSEPGFVYLSGEYKAVYTAYNNCGVGITPFDTPYLSWYAGTNVLYGSGVPANVSKEFYIPVVFVPPAPSFVETYYVSVPPLNSEKIPMKPLATLGTGISDAHTTVYYALVPVKLSNPIGFYKIAFAFYKPDGSLIKKQITYMNSEILSYLNQINLTEKNYGTLVASELLDMFISKVKTNYVISKMIAFASNKSIEEFKKNFYVSNGVLYAFNNGLPLYAMELGYLTFDFNDSDHTVIIKFQNAFENVSTYKEFVEVAQTPKDSWNKLFGVNILYNPKYLAYVTLNPGDEKRVVNVEFFMPVDTRKDGTASGLIIGESGKVYSYEITSDGSIVTVDTLPNEPDGGYYLATPDKGRYVVGGYDFIDLSGTVPFYEVKVLYVPNGGEYDVSKVEVYVNGKRANVVWNKEDITKVYMKYYNFIQNATPSVVVKPYVNFLVFDIYAPPSDPITHVKIVYDGQIVFDKIISEDDSKYLSFLNLFDAGLLPDFGFYAFDWMQP